MAAAPENGLFRRLNDESALDAAGLDAEDDRWRVDDGISLAMSTNTDTKIRQLRQLFDYLGRDTDELSFTLRPSKPDETDASSDGDEATSIEPWREVTKFAPRFDELVGTAATAQDSAELRTEFRAVFDPLAPIDTRGALGGSSYLEMRNDEVINVATSQQILAVIALALTQEEQFDPNAIHHLILDGRMSAWLARLHEADSGPETRSADA